MNLSSNWKIQNGGSNMADENAKSYLIGMIFGTSEFLGSLITNPSSTFRNSEWRIQYGGRQCKKLLNWDDIWYLRVFGIADYGFKLKGQKIKNGGFNMAGKIEKVT